MLRKHTAQRPALSQWEVLPLFMQEKLPNEMSYRAGENHVAWLLCTPAFH